MINKKGFSLIEIIIATLILTTTVFGVYKLISENTKAVELSNIKVTNLNMFEILKTCIDNKKTATGYLDIGEDYTKCEFQKDEKLNTVDGINYTIFTNKREGTTIEFWDMKIYNDYSGTSSGVYVKRK